MTKQSLFTLKLFDLTLRLKGFPMQEAQAYLRKVQQIPESDYGAYIETSRKEVVRYHLEHNPFYKNFIANRDVSTWENIPILQKGDLQCLLSERISSTYTLSNVYTGKTSGSSGTPLHYAKDRFCHALTWAGIKDRFGWYGIDFNRSYQARFYGIPLSGNAYRKERLKDWFSNRYRFPIFDLSEKKLQTFLDAFKRKKFDFINGHTSSLVLFANYLKSKELVLTEVCPSLTHCIVTSEMLFPDDKVLLEEQLGVPIINEYGASELDLLAFTNTTGALQVNSESVFVEIVDEYGKSVPNGSAGKIVVTALYNKAHPFIRYEVGDVGVLDETSTAKVPILKELLGRSNDTATLANGTTVPGHTFYYVAKSAMKDNTIVKEFTIEQNTVSAFTLTYVAERDLNTIEIEAFKQSLHRYLHTDVTLTCTRVAMLDRSSRGKLKQFISHL